MDDERTQAERPAPRRPKYGWLAWEATVGYIAQNHSPDATLKMEISPNDHIIAWMASLAWGDNYEEVINKHSLADVLSSLWQQVDANHPNLLKTYEAITRRPMMYDDDSWLDEQSYDALSRLVHVTDTVFQGDWQVIVMYRPVEAPDKRLQSRLIADDNHVNRGGQGATLRDACRDVYRKAAPIYQAYRHRNA
jgi:hypothetical protein